jgi:hypothetical protein
LVAAKRALWRKNNFSQRVEFWEIENRFATQSAFLMENTQRHLEHLAEMRSLMERSTRFLSLSGLSGVWAGTCALAGAALVHYETSGASHRYDLPYYDQFVQIALQTGLNYKQSLVTLALLVFAAALAGGWFFTARKAKQRGQSAWDASSRRLLKALALPLATGGVFCTALLYWDLPAFLAPSTLIFYGLALVNGSKYTLRDVEYLGFAEIALGLAGMFLLGHGLALWALGFGALHIFYGLWMYRKYDWRN